MTLTITTGACLAFGVANDWSCGVADVGLSGDLVVDLSGDLPVDLADDLSGDLSVDLPPLELSLLDLSPFDFPVDLSAADLAVDLSALDLLTLDLSSLCDGEAATFLTSLRSSAGLLVLELADSPLMAASAGVSACAVAAGNAVRDGELLFSALPFCAAAGI